MAKLNESWSELHPLFQVCLAISSTAMKLRDTRQIQSMAAVKTSATCGLETAEYLFPTTLKLQLSLKNCFADQTLTYE